MMAQISQPHQDTLDPKVNTDPSEHELFVASVDNENINLFHSSRSIQDPV